MAKKNKVIDAALAALEKRFGGPVVQKMSDTNNSVRTFPTGREKLTGKLGGYAIGKIIEIFGEEATGKTGIALDAIKVIQDQGGNVALIDAEHALNTKYCEEIGVNIEDLYISQPECGEEAFETMKALIGTGEFSLIVIDSVAAMIPRAELEGESGESKMGLHARIMSQGLKMVKGIASENDCTLIFINQLRDSFAMYGAKKKPTGGNALKFYASQRMEIKNRGQIKDGSGQDAQTIGFKQEIRIIKNKVAPPFQIVSDDIVYGKGIDELTGLIEACVFEGVLIKAGAFFKYDGTTIAQGMKKLRGMLEDNPELVETLQGALKKVRG